MGARLAGAFGAQGLAAASSAHADSTPAFAPDLGLAPGDAVGVSLIRGDFEMGATGTVTYVDGIAGLRVRPSVSQPRADLDRR